jgi:hypothetical protein
VDAIFGEVDAVEAGQHELRLEKAEATEHHESVGDESVTGITVGPKKSV